MTHEEAWVHTWIHVCDSIGKACDCIACKPFNAALLKAHQDGAEQWKAIADQQQQRAESLQGALLKEMCANQEADTAARKECMGIAKAHAKWLRDCRYTWFGQIAEACAGHLEQVIEKIEATIKEPQ